MSAVRIYSGKSSVATLATNGLGTIDATSCKVYEEINGEFSCEISIPVDSHNSEYFLFGAIIRVSSPRGNQFFRLGQVTTTLTTLSAKAWHISYDLSATRVINTYIDAKTGAEAIAAILSASPSETRFTGTSNITRVNNMRMVQQSPIASIMNTEVDNCFLKRWGGEVYRDNFTLNVNSSIGASRGYVIALGKNLMGVTETPSGTGYTNRIIPKCLDENDLDLFLPELYIDSELENPYDDLTHTVIYKCEGIKHKAEDSDTGLIPYPTREDCYTAMRAIVAELYELGADVPGVTVDIDFVDLLDTEEYKQFTSLQKLDLQLGDTVKCKYWGKTLNKRVASYLWDCLSDKYSTIAIGDVAKNVAQSLFASDVSLEGLKSEMVGTVKQSGDYYGVGITHDDGLKISGSSALSGAYAKYNADVMGFFDSADNFVGGLAIVNSIVAVIAKMMTNSVDADFYMVPGDVTIDSIDYTGLFGYLKSYSTTTPLFKIVASHSVIGSASTSALRIQLDGAGEIFLKKTSAGASWIFAGTEHYASGNPMCSMMLYKTSTTGVSTTSMKDVQGGEFLTSSGVPSVKKNGAVVQTW